MKHTCVLHCDAPATHVFPDLLCHRHWLLIQRLWLKRHQLRTALAAAKALR